MFVEVIFKGYQIVLGLNTAILEQFRLKSITVKIDLGSER